MTKIEKILAAYERFGTLIEGVPDEQAVSLRRMSSGARELIAEAKAYSPKVNASQMSAGLEQGLRELPLLILQVDPAWREKAAKALHEALVTEYPEFIASESEKLRKILDRRKIRTESEFYRVRHEIDVLEGIPGRRSELQNLYALVEAYENRS